MGITVGPSDWWVATPTALNALAIACPVGTTLPDRSRIICKAGGTAWIVAPSTTQVSQTWNNSTNTQVGNKCCVCDWPTLCACMIACGFNPNDWFVPSSSQLNNPGYVCRTQWDTFASACIGPLLRYLLLMLATRTSAMAASTASVRRTRTVFVPSGV